MGVASPKDTRSKAAAAPGAIEDRRYDASQRAEEGRW
jgi:hypothetical protein